MKQEKKNKLQGKVAIVTGGTSGMGEAVVRLFTREGARVVFGGRDRVRAEALSSSISKTGGKAVFRLGDIGLPETSGALVREAVDRYGRLDILVASAGMLGLGSVTEVEPETWDRTIATNLTAVFHLMRYAIPQIRQQGSGSIIVISSIAGFKGFPNHPAYCASKGGLNALVRQAAIDYSPAVRINALCPGPVDTPLIWSSARAFPDPSRAVQDVAEKNPMKRLGTPDDIASATLFLASDESSWITGSLVTIDGGISCL